MLPQKLQAVPNYAVHLLMGVIAALMIYYGASLAHTTWFQSYPEFEYVKVDLVYSAIPGSGVILLLFVIEAFLFPHVVAEVGEEELARATEQAEAEERRLAGVVPGVMVGVALLVLGTFMDMAPLILICTPILLPVMKLVGVDPVHFGIVMMLNLSIGLVTPPVGTVLFVGCAIGKVAIEKVTRGLWPFWIAMLVVLMLVTYLPALAMWVPNLVYGR